MLLEVGHEGSSAGAYGGRIARVRLVLAVNVAVGVSDVDLTKLREQLDAGAIGLPKFGMTSFPCSHMLREHRSTLVVGGVLQRLQKRAVTRWHIVPHLLEVDG